MKNSKINPTDIVSVATIILIYHYFLSYKWMSGLLEVYDLELFSIITYEDILFTWGKLNLEIMPLIGICFILLLTYVILLELFLSENLILKAKWALLKSKNWWWVVLLITFIIGIISYLSVFPNSKIMNTYLIVISAIGVLFLIFPTKRGLLIGGYIIATFWWSNYFVDHRIEESKEDKSPSKYTTEIEFKYDEKSVATNDSIRFIIKSYKYLILRNNKSKELFLYPNERIGMIKYLKNKDEDSNP